MNELCWARVSWEVGNVKGTSFLLDKDITGGEKRCHWPLHRKYILKVSTVFDICASSILMFFILLFFRILLNNLVNFSFVQ